MQTTTVPVSIRLTVILAFLLNLALWFATSDVQPKWPGVPPVPSEKGAVATTLGDRQFSYRIGAMTLQNLGDTGGRVTPLKDYDYNQLDKWFRLLWALDDVSDHVPMTAAYYFGAIREPKDKVRVIVDYLAKVGNDTRGEKWRWLAHAVFLARHRLDDLEYALELAYELAALQPDEGDLPMWARQMPVFVLTAQGEKDAARAILYMLLQDSEHLHPNEVNFMKAYLEEQLGEDSSGTIFDQGEVK